MKPLGLLLLALVVLSALAGCSRPDPEGAPQDIEATVMIRKARIHLIAIEGREGSGDAVGCGDRTGTLDVELPTSEPALWGALHALLDAGKRYQGSGLYNALANSPLKVERIDRRGGEARVYLTGYLELGGECDSPRVLAQLTRTATQFSDVKTAEFFLDGKPLRDLLSGKG
ncbi:MAG: GerMN domain-containing protein [Thermoanaerobaculia bacterium]